MTDSKQMNIYDIIGKNIRKYRKAKHLTQRALAEKLLFSESFIAKLESKSYQTISIATLEQVAKVLEVDIVAFFDRTVEKDYQ
ncbi:MAG: helix-turn-helix transcriptional regulator [Bacilli bacterium]|nr:helix-turn-helix transcriptional regulator [Bacilli bacterium]